MQDYNLMIMQLKEEDGVVVLWDLKLMQLLKRERKQLNVKLLQRLKYMILRNIIIAQAKDTTIVTGW